MGVSPPPPIGHPITSGSLFLIDGLGGDGNKDKEYCVQTGAFREGVWTHPAPEKKAEILTSIYDVTGQCSKVDEPRNVTKSCLRRSFNHKPANLSHVLQTISLPCTKFKKFDKIVREDYHNDIHNSIGESYFLH